MDEEKVIFKAKDIDSTEIDGEVVMMDMEKGKYFMLNGVGSDIWSLINGERTISQIANELTKIYDIDEKKCSDSVSDFINRLSDAKLIILE